MITLPLRADLDDYELQVPLDEATYDLRFRWNERDDTWYMWIYSPDVAEATDGSRTPIIGGIPVLVGWPLLRQFQMTERPAGDFIAIDTSKQDKDPGRRDLGERVILVYGTAEEIAARYEEAQ